MAAQTCRGLPAELAARQVVKVISFNPKTLVGLFEIHSMHQLMMGKYNSVKKLLDWLIYFCNRCQFKYVILIS